MFAMTDSPEYRDALPGGVPRGRGAGINPGNRYESVKLHVLGEFLDEQAREREAEGETGQPKVPTRVYQDASRSIINKVVSDDVPFEWSVNPYRGCEHGCVYCYARPDHERLGFSSGLDFETKIMAKMDAPQLLREELARPSWKGEVIAMPTVTDCYQPIEEKLRVTRGVLEVMAECRQPVGIVTKNRLVTRDIDLFKELTRFHAVKVAVSVTSLDADLSRKMEPRASSPRDRLRAISELTSAGVHVMVMVAPIVPGLNDKEIPAILKAASEAGAKSAGYVLLRLPWQLKEIFVDWLQRNYPERAGHVESLIRDAHNGKLYDAAPGQRRRGSGAVAEQISQMMNVFRDRYGLRDRGVPLSGADFRRPRDGGQMELFGE